MELPRRNFYYTDLFSPDLYERIWTDTLYVTQTFVYRLILDDERQVEKLSKGNDDFWVFLDTIQCYNRCFVKLVEDGEATGAMPFIRLQLDNLVLLYAESRNIGKVLYKVFDNKRMLNQVKVGGEKLSTSELLKEMDEKYNGLHELWKKANQYIHPTSKTNSLEAFCVDSYYSKKLGKEVMPQREKKRIYTDMVYVNKIIVDVLYTILDNYIALIKEHKLYTFYRQHIADTNIKY